MGYYDSYDDDEDPFDSRGPEAEDERAVQLLLGELRKMGRWIDAADVREFFAKARKQLGPKAKLTGLTDFWLDGVFHEWGLEYWLPPGGGTPDATPEAARGEETEQVGAYGSVVDPGSVPVVSSSSSTEFQSTPRPQAVVVSSPGATRAPVPAEEEREVETPQPQQAPQPQQIPQQSQQTTYGGHLYR